jgi:hypothetical protein
MEGQVSLFDLDSPCGKTSQAHFPATKERTSKPSSKRSATSGEGKPILFLSLRKADGILPGASWEMVGALPGASWMPLAGAYPSVEKESFLWQILQENAPQKYSLTKAACMGILRRAEKRGKELPPMLKEALEEVIALSA